ncbi:MAG TPA: EF-hand domain-containing protein [Sphingomonas sp.]|nr:EF-hand domain-containing protein [Sphingomonas sp.]
MWRYWVGAATALVLVAGGIFWWRNTASAGHRLPDAPAMVTAAAGSEGEATPEPPAASEKTREEKRFSRSDHDKNGLISRDEFFAARRRNFAKLDVNGDGKLSFDEYAAKAVDRFGAADADKSGGLSPAEFATTRVIRQARPVCACQQQGDRKNDDGD